MWVRGLKHDITIDFTPVPFVAPHVGAWIETYLPLGSTNQPPPVAPHVGAWIETLTRK